MSMESFLEVIRRAYIQSLVTTLEDIDEVGHKKTRKIGIGIGKMLRIFLVDDTGLEPVTLRM